MKSIAISLVKWLNKSYHLENILQNSHIKQMQFPLSIELEYGEPNVIRGFSSNKQILNKINTAKYQNFIALVALPYNFLKRIGNFIQFFVFLMTIISNYNTELNEMQISPFFLLQSRQSWEFLTPFFFQIIVYVIIELYFDQQKRKQDKEINSRKTLAFKRLKKLMSMKLEQQQQQPPLTPPQQTPNQIIPSQTQQLKPKTPSIEQINNNQTQKVNNNLQTPRKGSKKFTNMLINTKFKNQSQSQIQIIDPAQQAIQKSKGYELFETKSWGEIEVGDIIILKQYEACPADILILDISDKICFVQSQHFYGKTKEREKRPPQMTHVPQSYRQKMNALEYKKMITGMIKYDLDLFSLNDDRIGFIRLKKDPKEEDITRHNIIFREQILVGSDYVYGLVLQAGRNCNVYKKVNQSIVVKQSFFKSKSNVFFILSFFNVVLLTLISWIVSEFQLCHSNNTNEKYEFNIGTLIFYLNNYISIMPHYFYLFEDLMILINALIQNNNYKQIVNFVYSKSNQSQDRISNDLLNSNSNKVNDPSPEKKQSNQNISPIDQSQTLVKGVELTKNKASNQSLFFQDLKNKLINYKLINNCNIADLVLTEYVCFDKTGTLTVDQIKVKAILLEDAAFKFKSKLFQQTDWKNFKIDCENQVKSLRMMSSQQSLREHDEIQQEIEEEERKGILGSPPSKKRSVRNTINLFDLTQNSNRKLSLQPQLLEKIPLTPKEGSPLNQESNFININKDELDDEHCVITSTLKSHVPKSIMQKFNTSEQCGLEIQQNLDLPLINIGQYAEDPPEPGSNMGSIERNNDSENFISNGRYKQFDKRSIRNSKIELDVKRRSLFQQNKQFTKNFQTKENRGGAEEQNNDIQNEKIQFMDHKQFYQGMLLGEISPIYQECILVFLLCHHTNTKYIYSEDCFVNDSNRKTENAFLKFSEQFEMKFVCSSQIQNKFYYILQIKDELYEFEILAFNHETMKRKKLGVLLRFPQKFQDLFYEMYENDEEEIGSVFFLREEIINVPSYLDLDKTNRDLWEKAINQMHQNGYRTVAFSKNILGQKFTNSYMERYESLKQQISSKPEDFDQLYEDIEKNLTLISVLIQYFINYKIVGVEEKLRRGAVDLVKYFHQAMMKIFILSGDLQSRVLPVAFKTGILDRQQNTLNLVLDSNNYDVLKLGIKQFLSILNNGLKEQSMLSKGGIRNGRRVNTNQRESQEFESYQRENSLKIPTQVRKQHSNYLQTLISSRKSVFVQKNQSSRSMSTFFQELRQYNILINGEALEVIQEDQYLLNHFAFLVCLSNSVIGYNLAPHQKKQMISIIHKYIPGNKKALAIGDGYNDVQMFEEADMSIQIENVQNDMDQNKDLFQNMPRKNSVFKKRPMFFKRIEKSIPKNILKQTFFYRKLWSVPSADVVVKNFENLLWLFLYESRQFAELFDDFLVFSFYRGFILAFSLLFTFTIQCEQEKSSLTIIHFLLFHSLYLIATQIFQALSKLDSDFTPQNFNLYTNQFAHNILLFKKKKILSFIFKINGNAIIQGIYINFFLYGFDQIVQLDGSQVQMFVRQDFLFVLVLVSELLRFFIGNDLKGPLKYLMIILLYIILILLIRIMVIYLIEVEESEMAIKYFFVVPQIFLFILAYILMQIVIHFIKEVLFGFFNKPLIKNELEFKDIEEIHEKLRAFHPPVTVDQFTKRITQTQRIISNVTSRIFSAQNDEEIDLSIQQMVQGSGPIGQDKINPFTLQFSSTEVENKFKRTFLVIWIRLQRYLHLMSFVCYDFFFLVTYLAQAQIQMEAFFILFSMSLMIQLVTAWIILTKRYEKHFYMMNGITVIVRLVAKCIYDLIQFKSDYTSVDDILLTQILTFILNLVILNIPILSIVACFVQMLTFLIRYVAYMPTNNIYVNLYESLNKVLIIMIFCLLLSVIKYKLTYGFREDFLLENSMKQETEKKNDVLAILLPKFIIDNIQNQFNEQFNEYDFKLENENVSILFCDICKFDDVINKVNDEIVQVLDSLFRVFDQQCSQNGMQKIETVGKTYMAAGGLSYVDKNSKFAEIPSVKRAINLAQDMMNFVKNFKVGNVGNLTIKIGIHYGKVIAGVIGYHKPQFSLIGDTVNTTSRVCSTGDDGNIIISSNAYGEIKDKILDINFERKLVQAKGKGTLETYVISPEKKVRGKNKSKNLIKTNIKVEQYLQLSDDRLQVSCLDQSIISEDGLAKSVDAISSQNIQRNPRQNSILLNSGREIKKQVRAKMTTAKLRNQNSSSSVNQQQSFGNNQTPQGVVSNTKMNQSFTFKYQLILQEKESIREGSEYKKERQTLLHVLGLKVRKELNINMKDETNDFFYLKDNSNKQLFMVEDSTSSNVVVNKLTLDIMKLNLYFREDQEKLALEFIKNIQEQGFKFCKYIIISTSFYYLIKSLLLLLIQNESNNLFILTIILRNFLSILFLVFYLLLNSKKFELLFYKEIVFIGGYCLLFVGFILECFTQDLLIVSELQVSESVLLIILLTSCPVIIINKKFIILLLYSMLMIAILGFKGWPWRYYYYILLLSLCQFGFQYMLFYNQLNNFNDQLILKYKKDQQANLLMYLLPQHVLDEFFRPSQQRKVLTDTYRDATLLFADIAGFTEYSSQVEANQVLNMLRNLFTEFDRTCLECNTYKLYTIGDCYVVFGVNDAHDRDPAQEAKNVVKFGFEMIKIIEQVRQQIKYDCLNMRIGVHTGTFIGGVLGTDIVRYDLYGADVVIANKMESNGRKGEVQVSEETRQLLLQHFPQEFEYEFNKEVEIPSIGRQTNGYIITEANFKQDSFDNYGFEDVMRDQEQ